MRASEFVSEAKSHDFMAGHCHVMALALKQLHPDWQIRAHVGYDDDEADDTEYRVDHVYTVAPDGTAYDCRGRFDNEQQLVGPDTTGGVDTQYVNFGPEEIKQAMLRGELKRFSKQDLANAMQTATQAGKQDISEAPAGYKEIEFVCVNPQFPDATDPALQKKMYRGLKQIDGVVPLWQEWGDYSESQASLSAIYQGSKNRDKILSLAKQLGVEVDLEQAVSADYVDRAMRGEHEGQQGLTEEINPDCFDPAFNDTQIFDGLTYRATAEKGYDDKTYFQVKVFDSNFQQVGLAKFSPTKRGLVSAMTSIQPEYQGQGLARNIYAYVRSLGNTIAPSRNQLPPGKAMWDSWKKSGDAKYLMRNVAERKQSPLEDFEGLQFRMVNDNDQLFVNAFDSSGGNELGHVTFDIGDGKELDPQNLYVKHKFRSQGIARLMYDFVKSKGYKIQRSWDQTDAGAGFWDKHRGEERVWEQDVAEGLTEYKNTPLQDYNGLQFMIDSNHPYLRVEAFAPGSGQQLAQVDFKIDDQDELHPEDLHVEERWRGQGIAQIMYDFVKSKGYTIHRSWSQTDAGSEFWNKHRGQKRVWEQGVAEGKQPGQPVVDAILKVMPIAQEIWFHGSRATRSHRKNSDTDILVIVPDDLVGDQYLGAVRILQKLSTHFDNHDIQPTKAETNIHRIAQEEGRLLWSNKQAVAENFADGRNPQDKGDSKRHGINTKASVTSLRKTAKQGGRKGQLAHWLANMKSGRAKKK